MDIVQNITNYDKEELEDILDNASKSYYDNKKENELVLEDNVFDFIKEYLILHYPDSKYVDNIGTDCIEGKVELPVWMGSMTNKKTSKQIEKWKEDYSDVKDYVISSKLDGISGLLDKKGMITKFYTRGNGKMGKDISHLLKYIKIPDLTSYNDITIRGELIIKLEKYNELKDNGANSRSFVSGIVNSKNPDKKYAEMIEFIPYELMYPICKMSEQLKKLKKIGFNVVKNTRVKDINIDILEYLLKQFKDESEYLIDGIIIKHNKSYSVNTSGNPDYAFAFKMVFNEQIGESEVVKVHWNASKFGILFPQIEIKPIVISGSKITFISGKSGKFIKDKKIGVGSIIKVIRTCDVIPDIYEIVKCSKEADMPLRKYKWNETNVDLISLDSDDKDKINIKLITDFFKTIKVDNLGPGIVSTLYSNNYNTIKKIIHIKYEDLLKIKGFKETISKKIVSNIKNCLDKMTIIDLMNASNKFGKGFGIKNLTMLYNEIPNIFEIKDISELSNKIENIKGFSKKRTEQFIKNFDEFKSFMNDLDIDLKNITKYKKSIKKNEKNVVFTGFRDDELKNELNKKKIDVEEKVNNNTIYLLCKDINKVSNKISDAKKKNIKIIDYKTFLVNIDNYV